MPDTPSTARPLSSLSDDELMKMGYTTAPPTPAITPRPLEENIPIPQDMSGDPLTFTEGMQKANEFVLDNLGTVGAILAAAPHPAAKGVGASLSAFAKMRGAGVAGQFMARLSGESLLAGLGGMIGTGIKQDIKAIRGDEPHKSIAQLTDEQILSFWNESFGQVAGETVVAGGSKVAAPILKLGQTVAAKSAIYKRELKLRHLAYALESAKDAEDTESLIINNIRSLSELSSPAMAAAEAKALVRNVDTEISAYARRPYDDIVTELQFKASDSYKTRDPFINATSVSNRLQERISSIPRAEGGVAKPWTEWEDKLNTAIKNAKQGETLTQGQQKNLKRFVESGGKVPSPQYRGEEIPREIQIALDMIESGKLDIQALKEMDPQKAVAVINKTLRNATYNKNVRLSELIEMAGSISQYAWDVQDSVVGGDRIARLLTQTIDGKASPLEMVRNLAKKGLKDNFGEFWAARLEKAGERYGEISKIRQETWYKAVFENARNGQSAADHMWAYIKGGDATLVKDFKKVLDIGTTVHNANGSVNLAKSAIKYNEAMSLLRSQFLEGVLMQGPGSTIRAPKMVTEPNMVGFSKRLDEYGEAVINTLFDTPELKQKLAHVKNLTDEITAIASKHERELGKKHFMSNLADSIDTIEKEKASILAAGPKQSETDIAYAARGAGRGLGSTVAMYGLSATGGAAAGANYGGNWQSALTGAAIGLGGSVGVLYGSYYLGQRLPLMIMRSADNPVYAGVLRRFVQSVKEGNLQQATTTWRWLSLSLDAVSYVGDEKKDALTVRNTLWNASGKKLGDWIQDKYFADKKKQVEENQKSFKQFGLPPVPVPLKPPSR